MQPPTKPRITLHAAVLIVMVAAQTEFASMVCNLKKLNADLILLIEILTELAATIWQKPIATPTTLHTVRGLLACSLSG